MHVNVLDPRFQTLLFTSILIAIAVLTAKKDPKPHEMNHSHTNELKGIAILMVIFSHIGYFLFSDHRFLFPLSIAGGVGVNLFLFLSGFGLTSSENKSKKPILYFYLKRLRSIFVPMWLVLILTLILDAFLLSKTYNLTIVIQSILGFFPVADVDTSINSPLWYFSLILFYYLIFPLAYRRSKPMLSIAIVLLLGIFMTRLSLPVSKDVLKLYQLHYLSFPLGMAFAYLNEKKLGAMIKKLLPAAAIRYFLIGLLALVFGYTAIHSGVGKDVLTEQLTSVVTMLALVLIFLLKDVHSKLLIIFGTYSYEIYLIQWPLMYRHDFIYKYTPAFLGTLLYIAVFIIIGFILNRIVRLVIKSE